MGRAARTRDPMGGRREGVPSLAPNGRLPRWGRASRPNLLPPSPAPLARKDAEAGGGASERGEASARQHVEGSYHACAFPPRSPPPSEEPASGGS